MNAVKSGEEQFLVTIHLFGRAIGFHGDDADGLVEARDELEENSLPLFQDRYLVLSRVVKRCNLHQVTDAGLEFGMGLHLVEPEIVNGALKHLMIMLHDECEGGLFVPLFLVPPPCAHLLFESLDFSVPFCFFIRIGS